MRKILVTAKIAAIAAAAGLGLSVACSEACAQPLPCGIRTVPGRQTQGLRPGELYRLDGGLFEIPVPKWLKPQSDTVTIRIIGDVMMHARQITADQEPFLRNIAPYLSEATFAVANMEFTLGGEPYTGYPSFSSPDRYADYVARCGVDVFLTANNHILDKGARGLRRTLERYRAMADSVKWTGSAGDSIEMEGTYPLMLRNKGLTVALVNFTYGTNHEPSSLWPAVCRMDRTEVKAAIRRAREHGADFIVAIPHWGTEYRTRHDASQGEWASWLASEGVDAIVGGHPHIVQDTTHIAGVPVIYSMGNAVSNMSHPGTRLELAVSLSFVRDDSGCRMLEPELRWMWCTLPGRLTDSYATIFVDEWMGRRDEWKDPSDYDNMMDTLTRIKRETGIER